MSETITDAFGKAHVLNGVDVSPERRLAVARECLRQCWQIFDLGGESMGRSPRCHFLESAMVLLGDPDPAESRPADENWRAYMRDVIEPLVSDVRTIEAIADERRRLPQLFR